MHENDDDLWSMFTSDVKPLSAKEVEEKKAKEETPPKDGGAEILPEPQDVVIVEKKSALKKKQTSNQMDKNTQQKLVQGKIKIERQIDLHGLNRDAAQDALTQFITKAFQQNMRMLLVITGKGATSINPEHWMEDKRGILKEKLPQWLSLAPLNEMVLQHHQARPRHGGAGAFYVYLRKNK